MCITLNVHFVESCEQNIKKLFATFETKFGIPIKLIDMKGLCKVDYDNDPF